MTENNYSLNTILDQLKLDNKKVFEVLEYFELNENGHLLKTILKTIDKEKYRELLVEYLSKLITFHESFERASSRILDEAEHIINTLQISYDYTYINKSKDLFLTEIRNIYELINNTLLYSYISKVYGRLLKYNLTPKSFEAITDLFSKIDKLITSRKDIILQILEHDSDINAFMGPQLLPLTSKNYAKKIIFSIEQINQIHSRLSESIEIDTVHSFSYFKAKAPSKEVVVLAKQFTSDVLQKFFMDEYFEQNVSMLINSSKYRKVKELLSQSLVNRSKDELMSDQDSAEALIYRLLLSRSKK